MPGLDWPGGHPAKGAGVSCGPSAADRSLACGGAEPMTRDEWLKAAQDAKTQGKRWRQACEDYSDGGRAELERGIREHLCTSGIPLLSLLIGSRMGPNWSNGWINEFVQRLAIEIEKWDWDEALKGG